MQVVQNNAILKKRGISGWTLHITKLEVTNYGKANICSTKYKLRSLCDVN